MDVISGSTVISDNAKAFRAEPRIAKVGPGMEIPNEQERERIAALDDADLVRESASGNLLAFDQLVVRYRDKALRLVVSVLGTNIDAEDVVQEIFIKVYLSLSRFRGDSSFSTYLYTITVNRCRDEMRKSKLRRFFSFDDWFSRNDTNENLSQENGHQLEHEERRLVVRQAMENLPPQTRMLLYLREVEELSYKELADIFDVEIGTIKSRLARSRDKLREELKPYMTNGARPGKVNASE